jgi:CRP-like cAMP-binding protein
LYVLEDGSCEVLVKGTVLKKEIYVRDIEPGNIFGEVALINGLRRTASVRSKVHCTVGAISEESFGELIRYFPEVKNRMKE